jgi:pimeloyl-ACP methyl ester carboxylesterase
MRPDEARALGDLASLAAASVATQAREVHQGVAERTFSALGPAASVVRTMHDRVANSAYTGAAALTGVIVRGGARALSLTRPSDAPSIEESTVGRVAIGVLNGAWGDTLERRQNPLAKAMTLRSRGRDVGLHRADLAGAFPAARPRVAVFLHGLGETDDAWRRRANRHVPYGDRLESELHFTSVYVRFNSGLHISHNGRRLAALLDELTAHWPTEIAEIVLIGHSMGGLVARSACHYADQGSWREKVRHVFMLGTPHQGAPLELAANAACHAISRLPETRGFAKPLKVRSAGVKDLGYGYVVDEDWQGHDPDAFWSNTGTEIPFLVSANHYFISATLSRDADAPLGRMIGDLLVLRSSAWSHGGRGEPMRFGIDHYRHLGGATHFDLLNHPAIYMQLRRWLTAGRALSAPPVSLTQRP